MLPLVDVYITPGEAVDAENLYTFVASAAYGTATTSPADGSPGIEDVTSRLVGIAPLVMRSDPRLISQYAYSKEGERFVEPFPAAIASAIVTD